MRYGGSRAQHIAAGSAVVGCFVGVAITGRLIGEPETWLHIGIGVLIGGGAAGCVAVMLDRLLPGRSLQRNVEELSD